MTVNQKIDKVDKAQNPKLAKRCENSKDYPVKGGVFAERNGYANQTFAKPAHERQQKQNDFYNRRLFIKPFIEIHNAPPDSLTLTIFPLLLLYNRLDKNVNLFWKISRENFVKAYSP